MDIDSGLFNIAISDEEDSAPEAAEPKTPGRARVAQTEEDFQAIRQAYTVKVENGDLPLNGGGQSAVKQEVQGLLHAVEELYFFKRYSEAVEFVQRVLAVEGDGGTLDEDTKKLLRYYESKCAAKV
ncbi:hypothetical protein BX600DRAFT_434570 [Xylariales sp. PMI_506]|nr:hypothetical protein BX600DRAFT_434570 [Xylariales sp. PMI_506]